MEEPRYGFRIAEPLRSEIYEYLNKRPMIEVDAILTYMFENPDPKIFYTFDGIVSIVEYMRDRCPRGEVKEMINGLQTKSLEKYKLGVGETVKPQS